MEPLELTEGAWVFTSALYQTTSTVIRTTHEVFVIDPNWLPDEVQAIRDFVDEIRQSRKLYLIFTHSDYDHIIGYGAFPNATIIASESFAINPNKEADVQQAKHFDLSHYITRGYPIVYPATNIVITRDRQILHYDETTLTFYLAPGHTDQDIFILFEPQGVWIAGDYLSDIEFPLINGSLHAYRQTLQKTEVLCQKHAIRFLIPGHGSVEDSVEGIWKRRAHAVQYLDDLEAHVVHGKPFPDTIYRQRYPFWEGILDWHQANIDHLRKALTKGSESE